MKKMSVALVMGFLLIGSASAGLVNWFPGGNVGDGSGLVDGVLVLDGWDVELFHDVNNDNTVGWQNALKLDAGLVNGGGLSGTVEDVSLGIVNSLSVIGLNTFVGTVSDMNLPVNADVYAILFDASDANVAGNFIVIDAATFNVGAGGDGGITPNTVYSTGALNAGNNWQAIPEPTVAALLGVFGGSMLVGRRLFSKKS